MMKRTIPLVITLFSIILALSLGYLTSNEIPDKASCYDSDKLTGHKYEKGYAVDEEGIAYYDECNSSSTLVEYFCTGIFSSPILGKEINCTFGCVEDACIRPCSVDGCCEDSDCNDNNEYTRGKCLNPDSVYANGTSASKCLQIPQLIGNRTYNLLIIEFAPQDIVYGNLYYCYDDISGYYLQDTVPLSI